jgi:hypothetical protein
MAIIYFVLILLSPKGSFIYLHISPKKDIKIIRMSQNMRKINRSQNR